MKAVCPCCGDELSPEDRLDAIQGLMIALDEGLLFGIEDEDVRKIVHQAIDLSDLGLDLDLHRSRPGLLHRARSVARRPLGSEAVTGDGGGV